METKGTLRASFFSFHLKGKVVGAGQLLHSWPAPGRCSAAAGHCRPASGASDRCFSYCRCCAQHSQAARSAQCQRICKRAWWRLVVQSLISMPAGQLPPFTGGNSSRHGRPLQTAMMGSRLLNHHRRSGDCACVQCGSRLTHIALSAPVAHERSVAAPAPVATAKRRSPQQRNSQQRASLPVPQKQDLHCTSSGLAWMAARRGGAAPSVVRRPVPAGPPNAHQTSHCCWRPEVQPVHAP